MLPKLQNWKLITSNDGSQVVMGTIYNDSRFYDGAVIITSAVVWFDGDAKKVQTNNTTYELGMPYMTETGD